MTYNHYHKDVRHLLTIDVYRTIQLFGVEHPAIQHAVKKLLCAGRRGAKDYERDLREAVDSINRALQMIAEDANSDGMQQLCTKLKASEPKQRGWPYLPDPKEALEAQAAVMREREEPEWIPAYSGTLVIGPGMSPGPIEIKRRDGSMQSFGYRSELYIPVHTGGGDDIVAYRVDKETQC